MVYADQISWVEFHFADLVIPNLRLNASLL